MASVTSVNAKPLAGKTMLVTGATAGIGVSTAIGLAERGATVVIAGRYRPKCEATVAQIKQQTGNPNVEYLLADLSALADVRRLAEEYRSHYNRLDVLVNNAGAIFLSRHVTAEGLEMTFALNHLSYFLLTTLLLDMLKASAPARIVNVASDAHRYGPVNFDDIQSARRYGGMMAYGQSKLANILFTYELAGRLAGSGVTANVLHPGVVATHFMGNNGVIGLLYRALSRPFLLSPTQGAQTSIYLAASPEVEGVTGKYFVKRKEARSASASYDGAAARRLWEVSEQLTAVS
jgi:NAD(P)-dependent dehydrogenase (short-subunit alcohol dehydrogenase family)